jgi:N-acetylglucosaminyldiphosphoundecaprenol N-acetyl-beta-D-mannosaminyltransferase
MSWNNVALGHVQVTPGDLDALAGRVARWIANGERRSCVPLNLTKYVMARTDRKLAATINRADLVVADGIAIVWLARRLGRRDVHRVTGIELAERLLSRARAQGWRLYVLGAKPENLNKAVGNLERQFNDPPIAGFRDGYFKAADVEQLVAEINAARPDILLLGLGLPQKEYFLDDHFDELDVRFCLTVGGAIDVWAGAKTRAPALVQKLGLEWFYRSVYDASRAGLILRYGLNFVKDLVVPPRRG